MTKPNKTSDEDWAAAKLSAVLALIQSRAAVVLAWMEDLDELDE